jgi:hypothetical protein
MDSTLLIANLWTMVINLIYAIVAMVIGLFALRCVDRLIFPEINFIQEVKKGNIAASIFSGMVLLFIALVLSSAVR